MTEKTQIVKSGKGHRLFGRHHWKRLPSNELKEKYELNSFENLDGWYGKYRTLWRCDCGEEVIVIEVAYI